MYFCVLNLHVLSSVFGHRGSPAPPPLPEVLLALPSGLYPISPGSPSWKKAPQPPAASQLSLSGNDPYVHPCFVFGFFPLPSSLATRSASPTAIPLQGNSQRGPLSSQRLCWRIWCPPEANSGKCNSSPRRRTSQLLAIHISQHYWTTAKLSTSALVQLHAPQ